MLPYSTDTLVQVLLRRRTSSGWGFHAPQVSIEATSLATLALRSDPETLYRSQGKEGAWPALLAPGAPASCWSTSLACIALSELCPDSESLRRGAIWLRRVRGQEAHPIWRWKFRWFDRHVRFDPSKCGWPWFEGTTSWVLPTAAAIIALRRSKAPVVPGLGRLSEGVEMLLDRATPLGGWNAGNGVVFGVSLRPHVDATAIALLALRGLPVSEPVRSAVRLVATDATTGCVGPQSLAWALLAMEAYGDLSGADVRSTVADRLIRSVSQRLDDHDTATLALTCIALSVHAGNPSPFEVHA